MDRYEYKLKLDEIRKDLSEGKIKEAAAIADTINWKKVKMVSALCLAGEVYEKAERYEESKELLKEAYERSPIGRTIIYRLALVAVKSGNIEEAEYYYNDFVEIAPTDNMRYVLKYQISRASGASVAELISILEEYKEHESSERFTYELAMLYHKAGMAEKCIDVCDELILWYGEGKYVEKALELKMLYQPLTAEQEKKFRKMKQRRSGVVEVSPSEELLSGEILSETRVIPEVTMPSPTFSTVNLQQELADNMRKIMEATEKETVSSHMENIKKLVNTIPYLKIPANEPKADVDEKYGHIETDEEIDGSLRIDFMEMLGEEQGGQMSFQVPDQPTAERQITGQMSIEEVLKEWEKTKQAAAAAMEMAEKKRLESAKAKALQEAEGIMDRLNDVLPQLEAGKTPRQLMEEEYIRKMQEDAQDGIEVELEPEYEPSDFISEEATVENTAYQEDSTDQEDTTDQGHIVTESDSLETLLAKELSAKELLAEELSAEEPSTEDLLTEEVSTEEALTEEALTEELLTKEDVVKTESASDEEAVKETKTETEIKTEAKTSENADQSILKVDTVRLPEVEKEEEPRRITFLTDAQKEHFMYFLKVEGMEKQICQAMDGILHKDNAKGSTSGNLLIEGGSGSGKTQLALDMIKALCLEDASRGQRVGKITASTLNQKNVLELLGKVNGGYLIIEKAGELNRETAEGLALGLEGATDGLTVIMEDSAAGIQKALQQSASLAGKFNTRITIPVFTNDELVHFAKSYAQEAGCEIEEIAILALYNRISNIQKVDRATYIAEVKVIMDEAIANAKHGGIKKAFLKKRTEDGKIIIHEKDFEK